MAARKLITIEGQQMPWDQGEWVFYDAEGRPYGCMSANARSGDDPVKAAREFWCGSTEAMTRLARGHSLKLMTFARWKAEIYPLLRGGSDD